MDFKDRDFLRIQDYSVAELRYILDVAKKFKQMKREHQLHRYYVGKNIVIIFEKVSARTRCSFEVAAYDLGMGVTYLDDRGIRLGQEESIADTARTLSQFYDGIEYRGYRQDYLEQLARYSEVPVWNGLTDYCHPIQALADFMTIEEYYGFLRGLNIAFVGDTHDNISNSLMMMSAKMGANYIACGPKALAPDPEVLKLCQTTAARTGSVITVTEGLNSLRGVADVVCTDAWFSLGEDPNRWGKRIELLKDYQVNAKLLAMARPRAIFLQSLPSFHDTNTTVARFTKEKFGLSEMEVTGEVFDSDRSFVFEEASNRLHVTKALMYLTMRDNSEPIASTSAPQPQE